MNNANEVRMRRKTFTHESKQECVSLVLQHNYPVTQTAETINIGLSTLQRWLRQYRGEVHRETPVARTITPEQRRIQELEKQVRQLPKRPGRHRYPRGGKPAVVAANLLNRQFNPETLNTWWSGNITRLRTAQGWLYLAIVMDLSSRKIVSRSFSDKPDSALAIQVLRLAANKRRPTGPVLFHSDQGTPYTSAQFQSCQQELDVTGSMSRKGSCLDNTVTERFFRNLKGKRVNYRRYETRSQGIADVINDIDSFYNLKRRHYRLRNISPNEYERRLQQCT